MEQEEKYYVYLHRNKINNKKYYGITSEKRPEIRWRKGYSHNAHFQNAIKKYGWDNFEHVILFDDLSKNEAEEKEKYLITRDNTTNPNNGYNLTSGGGLGVFRHSERSKQLMSEHTKGELNPMYGKTHSETTKMKIKSRLTNHPNTSKKVLCEETGLIYRSTREAERLTGIKHTCINEAALPDGNQNTAGGYHWVYIKEENNMEQIITSLLETDAYKLSMGQAIYHQFSDYKTTWSFKCRNKDVHFTPEMVEEIRRQIKLYCSLRFTEDELTYIDNIKWMKGSYVDFLRLWQPRYEDFEITTDSDCGLSIETFGTWLNTSMYEIPTLAIVNEVYFRMAYNYEELLNSFKKRLNEKYENLRSGHWYAGTFSEFGLRRRLSAEAQELAVEKFSHLNDTLHSPSKFVGTSNVYLAKKYNLTPVGTMAHEWIMCSGQGNHKHNPAYSNWYALDAWVREYGVLNGIALTDTITTDCFLKDFQLTYATLFSGVRHDSGDPIEWGEKMINHYESLGINPKTKTLLFSDSLDFERADKLFRHFHDRVNVAFGIGTYLSNDTDVPALNIVMKTTKCNGMDVAKVSDVEGKGMCKNPDYVDYLKRCINWRMNHE